MTQDRFVSCAIAALALAGCAPSEEEAMHPALAPSDPQVEAYIFRQCLELAKGPKATHYNDADETVSECGRQASWKSKFCPEGQKCAADLLPRSEVRQILGQHKEPAQ